MYNIVRSSVWNPIERKVETKSIYLGKEGKKEEAQRKLWKWREKRKCYFRDLKYNMKPEYSSDSEEEIQERIPVTKFKLKLDPSTGSTLALVGSSKSGKTTFIKYINENYFKDNIVILFATNSHIKKYDDFDIKCSYFNEMLIKMGYKINLNTDNYYKFCFMFDDMIDDTVKNNATVKRLITVYRNADISTVISIQDVKLLRKTNRENINYITFHKMNNIEAIKENIEIYLSPFLIGKDRVNQYIELTANYHFLLLDIINNKLTRHKIKI
jgi:hypothetical protein